MDCPGAKFTGSWGTAEGEALHFSNPFSNTWAEDTNLAIQRAVAKAMSAAAEAMDKVKPDPCGKPKIKDCTCVPSFCVMLDAPKIFTAAGQSITFGPTGSVPFPPVSGAPSVGGGGQLNPGLFTTNIIVDIVWWLWQECTCQKSKPPTIPGRFSGTIDGGSGFYEYGGSCTYCQGEHTFDQPCQSPWTQKTTVRTFDGSLTGTDLAKAEAEVRDQACKDMADALLKLAPCVPGCTAHAPMMRMFPAVDQAKKDDDGAYTVVMLPWFVSRVCGDPKPGK